MGLGRIVAGVVTLGGSEVVRHVFKKRADGTEVELEQENAVADEISMIPLPDASKPAADASLIDPAEFTAAIDRKIAERDAAVSAAAAAKVERDEAITAKAAAVVDRDAAITAKAEALAKVGGLELRATAGEARAVKAEQERDAAVLEAGRLRGEFQKFQALATKLGIKPKA